MVLQGPGMEISNLSKPMKARGEGRGRGRLGETLSMYVEQGPGSPLPSQQSECGVGRESCPEHEA